MTEHLINKPGRPVVLGLQSVPGCRNSFLLQAMGGFNMKKAGRLLDDQTWNDMPVIARINGCIGYYLINANQRSRCEPGADYKLF